jgi:ABC-type Fe3+ transport system substrate-binding protein
MLKKTLSFMTLIAAALLVSSLHAQDAKLIAAAKNEGKAFIDFFLGPESMAMLAKQGEFVNRRGIKSSIADADKIQFVEMNDLDAKGFAQKKKEFQEIFLR